MQRRVVENFEFVYGIGEKRYKLAFRRILAVRLFSCRRFVRCAERRKLYVPVGLVPELRLALSTYFNREDDYMNKKMRVYFNHDEKVNAYVVTVGEKDN